jgi:hypothetical protein
MEKICAAVICIVMVAIVWGIRRQEKRKKMDAMVEETQKLCQARLRENAQEGGQSME